ncbi:hypothetical protein IMF27_28005 [Pseudomonas sp. PCH199]|uniref:hypothetical protein n=1 Tax=unclassified Pseudomonas TaxID=196821 RepID=UPI000BC51EF8|nr:MULTISPECIES: hypothetical protein [unclassified Pseudomonas]MCW8278881.1 hypothetical protein [Pseudomonas sp. PCH199]PAM79835.1 hypothetical protein CES87_28640 [Pseudomonas sp. ERMR1:02]
MSTEQERSFIACIRCDDAKMKFFDEMPSRSAGQGNLLTSYHHYSEISKGMVKIQRALPATRTRSDEMIAFFDCYDDYYNIQILSEAYLGKYLSKNTNGILGAFPAAGGDTTSFNLLNANQDIITLDDLKTDTVSVYLKARNTGMVKRQLMQNPNLYCFGDQSGESVKFTLSILERNVPLRTISEPYPLYIEPRLQDDDED